MNKYFLLSALLAGTAMPATASTVSYVMDFSTGDVCANADAFNVDLPRYTCTVDGQTIALGYGDQPGVDVEWRRSVLTETDEGRFNIRGTDGDAFATIPSNLHTGSIILRALDGATVGLQGFDMVGRPTFGSNASSFTINDLAGVFTSIVEALPISLPSERREFSFANLTSTVGIEILLGPDASSFGWGIDNIAYSVAPGSITPPPPQPIPLPATGLLLVGGLAGLAALRRRRRGV